jgi:hypothetical protein
LLCLWAAALAWVPRVDYRWTAQLTAYRHHPFAGLARRTVFQGQLPGATDPAALLAVATVVLYLRAHRAAALLRDLHRSSLPHPRRRRSAAFADPSGVAARRPARASGGPPPGPRPLEDPHLRVHTGWLVPKLQAVVFQEITR